MQYFLLVFCGSKVEEMNSEQMVSVDSSFSLKTRSLSSLDCNFNKV